MIITLIIIKEKYWFYANDDDRKSILAVPSTNFRSDTDRLVNKQNEAKYKQYNFQEACKQTIF